MVKTPKTTKALNLSASPTSDAPRDAGPDVAQPSPNPSPASPKGKIAAVVDLLRRPEGARIDEMMTATGWQAHSVRGAMSGAVKKKLGLTITSEKSEGIRTYRIAEPAL